MIYAFYADLWNATERGKIFNHIEAVRSRLKKKKTRKRNSRSSLITSRGLVILSRYMSTAYKRVTPPAAALTRSTAICSSFKQKMIWINWDSSLIGIKRAEIRAFPSVRIHVRIMNAGTFTKVFNYGNAMECNKNNRRDLAIGNFPPSSQSIVPITGLLLPLASAPRWNGVRNIF